jgi:hypothetical protein
MASGFFVARECAVDLVEVGEIEPRPEHAFIVAVPTNALTKQRP